MASFLALVIMCLNSFGTQTQPNFSHFGSFAVCFLASAAKAAAASVLSASDMMLDVRGDVTVKSSAAGF